MGDEELFYHSFAVFTALVLTSLCTKKHKYLTAAGFGFLFIFHRRFGQPFSMGADLSLCAMFVSAMSDSPASIMAWIATLGIIPWYVYCGTPDYTPLPLALTAIAVRVPDEILLGFLAFAASVGVLMGHKDISVVATHLAAMAHAIICILSLL
jgi:hypothetical protein